MKAENRVINELLTRLDVHPVLIDIGSAGGAPKIWNAIASRSTYVGFDPGAAQTTDLTEGFFHKTIVVNEAVTAEKGMDRASFYVTQSPSCSSTLRPDDASLSQYFFADLFSVQREEAVSATQLDSVLDRFSLSRVDWFKTDSQGIDLRLFHSLREKIRNRVLAIDIEPGLIDAYVGEDLFVDAHRDLTRSGFWLANLEVKGAVRLRKATPHAFGCENRGDFLERGLKKSPAWCEARYLRTLESIASGDFGKADYVLLWIFALLDNQVGFAADLTIEYENIFGSDALSQSMRSEVRERLRQPAGPLLVSAARHLIPSRARRYMRSYLKEILQ